MELIREPTLLPILLVVMLHAAAFLAWSLTLLVQDRRMSAAGALLGMLVGSASAVRYEVSRRRRPGALSLVVVVTWLLGVVMAWAARHFGAA